MTLVTIIAIAAIGGLIYFFLPTIKQTISDKWTHTASCEKYDDDGNCIQYSE